VIAAKIQINTGKWLRCRRSDSISIFWPLGLSSKSSRQITKTGSITNCFQLKCKLWHLINTARIKQNCVVTLCYYYFCQCRCHSRE